MRLEELTRLYPETNIPLFFFEAWANQNHVGSLTPYEKFINDAVNRARMGKILPRYVRAYCRRLGRPL